MVRFTPILRVKPVVGPRHSGMVSPGPMPGPEKTTLRFSTRLSTFTAPKASMPSWQERQSCDLARGGPRAIASSEPEVFGVEVTPDNLRFQIGALGALVAPCGVWL